jgi:hypothetical protein
MIAPATMNLNTGDNRVGRWSRVKMSALGQKRTCAMQLAMSAKGQKRTSSCAFSAMSVDPFVGGASS